jgi:hypothetical protein
MRSLARVRFPSHCICRRIFHRRTFCTDCSIGGIENSPLGLLDSQQPKRKQSADGTHLLTTRRHKVLQYFTVG